MTHVELQAALNAFQSGDYAAAERHARSVLAADAANYDALHLVALAALHAGRPTQALERVDALLAAHPSDPYAHNSRGAVLQALGRLEEAIDAYRRGGAVSPPAYGDAWVNAGLLLTRLKRHREAAEAYRAALAAKGRDVQLLAYLGAALFEAGDAEGAEAAFREALTMLPANAALHANHAAALMRCGRAAEAIGAARQAVSRDRGNVAGWEILVSALLQMGDPAAADASVQEARAAGVATARLSMGQALARIRREDDDGACQAASEALQRAPGDAEVAGIDAFAKLSAGDLDGALAGYRRARELAPTQHRWRFLEALACPALFDSGEDIASRLAEVDRALAALESSPATLADPYGEVGMTPFFFAYTGVDDTVLQRRIARAYAAACPSLEDGMAPGSGAARIRVGIVSAHLRNHSIGKLNLGFAQFLDRSRFELVVVRPSQPPDEISALFDQAAERVLTVPWHVARARDAIVAARLDAIFFPDIGMDAFTYFLAFARMAPLQFTTWGHPVTTGIPNVDCFVSSRRVETPGSEARYTERLVRFDALPSYYHRPRPASAFDIRAQLGASPATRLYACPQTLFKFHPDFDAALVSLLRRDPAGLVLLVQSRHRSWNERLMARLQRAGPDVVDRIRLLPAMALPDFFAMLRDADALLDPFHFGGGTSTYEALSIGSPVVTLPGAAMRGRITAGWYDTMGEDRWTATSVGDFIERACALAHAPDRARVRREVAQRAAVLVENPAIVRELERFLEGELASRRGR